MDTFKDKCCVTGVGETAYTRGSAKSPTALQMEASLAAIADAGLSPKDIDGVIPFSTGSAVAEDFVTNFGIEDLRYSVTAPMGGASCVAAIQSASAAITAGIATHVLLPMGRRGYRDPRRGRALRRGSPHFPSSESSANSRCPTVPLHRFSSMRPWRAVTWHSMAPPAGSLPKSR